jgi:hypothetical protein
MLDMSFFSTWNQLTYTFHPKLYAVSLVKLVVMCDIIADWTRKLLATSPISDDAYVVYLKGPRYVGMGNGLHGGDIMFVRGHHIGIPISLLHVVHKLF